GGIERVNGVAAALSELREQYVRAKREAPRTIAAADARITRARTQIEALVSRGYTLFADVQLKDALRLKRDAEAKAEVRDFVAAGTIAGRAIDEAERVFTWARDFEASIAQ